MLNYIIEKQETLLPSFDISLPKWTTDKFIKSFFLALLFILQFGTLGRSPLNWIQWPLSNLLFALFFVFLFFYVADLLVKGAKLTSFDILVLLLFLFIPVYSGLVSFLFWGQPIIYGITTQFEWAYLIFGLVIFYLLKTKWITLFNIRDTFLSLSWILLGIYIIAAIIFNPAQYYGTSFVFCNQVKGGCGFRFDIFLIAFSAIYYFIKFIRTRQAKYLIYFLLFFCYIFFEYQKRGLIIMLSGTLFLYMIFNLSLKRFVFYSMIFLFTVTIAAGVFYVIKPETLSNIRTMYSNVLDVLQGEESGEQSADARILVFVKAAHLVQKHPASIIFGNGKWSERWGGNPSNSMGYFYPADIGLLGSVFIYGLLGVLIVHIEFLLSIIWLRKIELYRSDVFLQSCKYYLLFFYLRGVTAGGSFFTPGPGITILFISIIYFYYYIETKKDKQYVLE